MVLFIKGLVKKLSDKHSRYTIFSKYITKFVGFTNVPFNCVTLKKVGGTGVLGM